MTPASKLFPAITDTKCVCKTIEKIYYSIHPTSLHLTPYCCTNIPAPSGVLFLLPKQQICICCFPTLQVSLYHNNSFPSVPYGFGLPSREKTPDVDAVAVELGFAEGFTLTVSTVILIESNCFLVPIPAKCLWNLVYKKVNTYAEYKFKIKAEKG